MGGVLERTYPGQDCSVARTLELVGERWTLLIVRDALRGVRRFHGFLASLDLARNVLAKRLSGLVEAGILDRVPYQSCPARYEYVLTAKGASLAVVIMALRDWGDQYVPRESGPATLAEHAGCGGNATVRAVCEVCDRPIPLHEVSARPTRAGVAG
jgi:DNA-binding HxlR family transcriptional regulator